ncbi:Gluconate 2-dehydrogenase subunit 3 [Hydrobacter penzbergensis]|uniref:Gluconate 2-dehydrogenase subunit 3 n=1 Tax=Hydrobacter penzbergensis TaxID=1235997 RepID=A0A8X8LDY8_9BACT|nr:gluconate 2-dehydrogenase subunit 3 family protein [Hydrobacter penzbergensis]SDW36016.1 Gluconate 2-dehydrogenase subunit 3 [Hydrobacter penzbergensis]
MDRRKSIKALVVGTVSTSLMIEACKPGEKKAATAVADTGADADRMQEEKDYLKKLNDKFFTAQEMATLTVLADIIVPKDAVSGSASDAKVPDFLEFIVKDMPKHQTPMRGGLRWLDVQCLKQYGKAFTDCDHQQQIAMVDQIAYPAKAKPEMKQGVSFFNLMRNLTVTGFFTSEMGVKDLGYKGNTPNQWNGVPDDVLKQYGLAYSEKELKECISY